MTYRDLTPSQVKRLRKQCIAAMRKYQTGTTAPMNGLHWNYAWSLAFLIGANFVEKKYAKNSLFDEKETKV
jgi:hypothetical protein